MRRENFPKRRKHAVCSSESTQSINERKSSNYGIRNELAKLTSRTITRREFIGKDLYEEPILRKHLSIKYPSSVLNSSSKCNNLRHIDNASLPIITINLHFMFSSSFTRGQNKLPENLLSSVFVSVFFFFISFYRLLNDKLSTCHTASKFAYICSTQKGCKFRAM